MVKKVFDIEKIYILMLYFSDLTFFVFVDKKNCLSLYPFISNSCAQRWQLKKTNHNTYLIFFKNKSLHLILAL